MVLRAIQTEDILLMIEDIASEITLNNEYLTELDSIGGDGDHGVNLERGFLGVRARLEQSRDKDVGSILRSVGTILMSTVGGSAGSLYGTLFMKAGSLYKEKREITAQDISRGFQEAENTLASLGGAKPGDKTMLDVLHPAAEAVSSATAESNDVVYILGEAAKAARSGLESTSTMIARKGRAMYLGNRTLGHFDVGAASLCIMIESCSKTAKKIDSRKTGENF